MDFNIFDAIIILAALIVPFFGGHHLNFLYREPDCGFDRMKIDKRFKKLFIFDKHDDTILKPAVYLQASAYIYILYVIVTIILRLIINNTEVWLAWIACIIPLGYMILTVLWGLYVSAKYNICKYLKERRTKKGKQE